jgi:hypothetical protein
MGNAHAWRHRHGRGKPCSSDCVFCKSRPSEGKYKNRNGHRHNPAAKKSGKRHEAKFVVGGAGRSITEWVKKPKPQRGLGSI